MASEDTLGGPSSIPDDGPSEPLPSDSDQVSFACDCLNVQIEGRFRHGALDEQDDEDGGQKKIHVWLGQGAETVVSLPKELV